MVQVKIEEGVLEGERLNSEFGKPFFSFKGIPYAEPPMGNLRFKPPIPKQPWSGVRQAKEHGPRCYQIDVFNQINLEPAGSEDCLYLNVYTPYLAPSDPLPVMVYIHGGGFLGGSGDDIVLGPEFLVKHDIILVTLNYRLEVIGFLCLDTPDVPGNAGMKDQVAALRWVKKNVSHFGGDPNNVTIFGESAGAACVSFHLVSPMTKGLFKRAIMQSGTMTCPWAYSLISAREKATVFTRSMGCKSNDSYEIYEFLKKLPIEELIMKQLPITYAKASKPWFDIVFNVVSERKFRNVEAFFTGDMLAALRDGIHEGVEVINGYTQDEGTVNFVLGLTADTVYEQANKFYELFVPQPLELYCSTLQQLEIGMKMKDFYLKNKNSPEEIVDQVVRFIGTDYFKYGASVWQKICAKRNKNKLFYYKFSCYSERNIFTKIFKSESVLLNKKPVSHCDDLTYLFPYKALIPTIDTNSKSYQMVDTVTKLWTNFAKYGNPTPDNSLGANWQPYTIEEQQYLDIGEELKPGTMVDKEEIDFWENIFTEYCPHMLP